MKQAARFWGPRAWQAGRAFLWAGVGWLLVWGVMSAQTLAVGTEPVPLARAHAHNDYEHARPLLDALEHGFMSVEADVHLVEGELLVEHDRKDVKPGRTLEALYLAPLRERIEKNGGRVYTKTPVGRVTKGPIAPGALPFTLLIDFKTSAEPTYAALKPLLERYRSMLTWVKDGQVQPGPVLVVISGDRPVSRLAAETERLAFVDGRPEDVEAGTSALLAPLVSESWLKMFTWRGVGPIPAEEKARLEAFVAQAQAQGRRVRFWATGDVRAGWEVLYEAQVDLLNADDLSGLREFLQKKAAAE